MEICVVAAVVHPNPATEEGESPVIAKVVTPEKDSNTAVDLEKKLNIRKFIICKQKGDMPSWYISFFYIIVYYLFIHSSKPETPYCHKSVPYVSLQTPLLRVSSYPTDIYEESTYGSTYFHPVTDRHDGYLKL